MSEEKFWWKADVPFLSPFCAALCKQLFCSPLTILIETWDNSRYGLQQMLECGFLREWAISFHAA